MDDAAAARKSDARKASREAGVYAYSRVAASLLIVLLPVVGARIYEPHELAYVLAIALLHESAMAIGSLGLADSVFYFIGRDPSGARMVVRQTTFLLVAVAIPTIAAMAFAGYAMTGVELVTGHEFDVWAAVPWLALVLLIELPTQPAVNQLIASGHSRLASALFSGFVVLRMIAILVPGIFGLHVEWVPIIMAVSGLTRLLAHVWIVRHYFPMLPTDPRAAWASWGRFKQILAFALPAGAAMVAGKINPQIDKYAANFFLDQKAFTEYGLAAFELPLVTLVPYAIAAVMQARYVRLYMAGDITGLRELWFTTVRKTALLVVPLTAMAIAVGHDLVVLLFRREYSDASVPFRIMTIVLLHRVAAYSSILQAVNRPRDVMVSAFLLIASNVLLAYPLTALFGYPGPAMSAVIAVLPAWAYVLWRIGVIFGGGIREALPWGFYGKILVLSGVLGVVVWAVVGLIPTRPGIRVLIGMLGYAALFVPAGRATRLIEKDDLHYIWQWLTLQMMRREKKN
jgi:O-antigen/teichoic acid export membrane protein